MWLQVFESDIIGSADTKLINTDNIETIYMDMDEDISAYYVECTLISGTTETLCETESDGTAEGNEAAEKRIRSFYNDLRKLLNNCDNNNAVLNLTGKQAAANSRQYAQSDLLKLSVTDIGLSDRECRNLASAGVNTLNDLVQLSYCDIEQIRGIGSRSAEHIVQVMAEFGISPAAGAKR